MKLKSMSSAPRDGTPFLAYMPRANKHNWVIATIEPKHDQYVPRIYYVKSGNASLLQPEGWLPLPSDNKTPPHPVDPYVKDNWKYHDEYEFWYLPYPGTEQAQAEEGVRWRGFEPWKATNEPGAEMRVYACYLNYGCEGMSEPKKVYLTRDNAYAWLEGTKDNYGTSGVVKEMESSDLSKSTVQEGKDGGL